MISLRGKTNFFEKRVGEYQKSNVMASLEAKNNGDGGDGGFSMYVSSMSFVIFTT